MVSLVKLNSDKDLYESILYYYVHSHEWASGLANKLNLPYSTTLCLCREIGCRRHKLVNNGPVSLSEFTKQPYAAYVIKKKGLKRTQTESTIDKTLRNED